MADTREEEAGDVDNFNPRIWNAGHPLLNQVVASKILEVVKLPELRSLRLVCKDWYSLSHSIWRRNVQINIDTMYYVDTTRPLLWESLGTQLDDVPGEQPFRNFRLHWTQFLADISKPRIKHTRNEDDPNFEGIYRNMERFWANYGRWIQKLELRHVYVTNWGALKKAIFEQTPNLQELDLDGMTDGREGAGDIGTRIPLPVETNKEEENQAEPNLNLKVFSMKHHCPELPFGWRLLFNRFPNIQKLEVPTPPLNWKSLDEFDEFVECLEEMLRNPARHPKLPITDLRLRNFAASAVQRILGMPLVKLKVFHFTSCDQKDVELYIFKTAMQFHGNTLEELHLQNGNNSMDFWGAQVVSYPTLTELEMMGSAYSFSLHFLNKLPNLKVLRLEQREKGRMLKGTNWTALETMHHLREFYFIVTDSKEEVLSEETLERFAKLMPNLESFNGQLENLTLQVVCRNWRKLRRLVINSGFRWTGINSTDPNFRRLINIDDSGITGIVSGSDERVPCVTDLQELQHLTLKHITEIGDASVFDGFLKLPHLSSLDVCENNKISANGLESLKRRLGGGLTISPLWE